MALGRPAACMLPVDPPRPAVLWGTVIAGSSRSRNPLTAGVSVSFNIAIGSEPPSLCLCWTEPIPEPSRRVCREIWGPWLGSVLWPFGRGPINLPYVDTQNGRYSGLSSCCCSSSAAAARLSGSYDCQLGQADLAPAPFSSGASQRAVPNAFQSAWEPVGEMAKDWPTRIISNVYRNLPRIVVVQYRQPPLPLPFLSPGPLRPGNQDHDKQDNRELTCSS